MDGQPDQFSKQAFDTQFLKVLKMNRGIDTKEGIQVLQLIVSQLVQLDPAVNPTTERNYKVRTILSQNTEVNNKLLLLEGGIETLIELMGFKPMSLGNPMLKPNYVFRHKETEHFENLRYCLKQFDDYLAVSQRNSKARPLAQLEQSVLQDGSKVKKQMSLQELRQQQVPNFKTEVKPSYSDTKGKADGRRIFVNHIKFYTEKLQQPLADHTIRLNQLFSKTLESSIDVKCAVLQTMVFDQSTIDPLFDAKIPITLFVERSKQIQGPLVEKHEDLNLNIVYQKKTGLDFGVFHSKLMMLEFDDRLRIVVSSSNLYEHDWHQMSQVIWFQDFFRKSVLNDDVAESEFQRYLRIFLEMVTPLPQCFRQQIDLMLYDFSDAAVSLVASVNGRHLVSQDINKIKLGQLRLQEICNPQPKGTPFQSKSITMIQPKKIVCQTSSIGNIKPGFLLQLYKSFTNYQTSVTDHISILFPTEEHVEDSKLGVSQASSIIMQAKYWETLPKECFCQQIAKDKALEGNLYHAKWIVCYDYIKEKTVINDNTCIYIGSHNLSQAAWGTLEKNQTQLAIYNCELGVVFGPKLGSTELKKLLIDLLPLQTQQPTKYNLEIDQPFIMEKQQIYSGKI